MLNFEKTPESEQSPNSAAADEELLISDIQPMIDSQLQDNDAQSDADGLLKTGAFTKELMMSSTLRGLGDTLKEAKAEIDTEEGIEEDNGEPLVVEAENSQQMAGEEDEDVIDIDNPDELAAKGLKRIQIEGEEEEFLMDMENNIYDLRGNFIGTTDGDNNEEEEEDDL